MFAALEVGLEVFALREGGLRSRLGSWGVG